MSTKKLSKGVGVDGSDGTGMGTATGTASCDSIIIEYFKLTQEYQERYGEKTVVFLQVGAFFEVYGIQNPFLGTYEVTPILPFSEACSLNIAEKKITLGNCADATATVPLPRLVGLSETGPAVKAWLRAMPPCGVVMAGVRDHQLDRYVQKMVDVGFTVVVYTQEKCGKVIERKLQDIFSPGTYLSYEPDTKTRLTNHITCVWFSTANPRGALRPQLLVGIASMNIFTGESYLFEYHTPLIHHPSTLDELDRHLMTMVPSEMVIVSEVPRKELDSLLKYVSLVSQGIPIHYVMVDEDVRSDAAKNCTKQTYIHRQLSATFYENAWSECLEFQENILATQAYCYLLHFVEQHNPDLIQRLQFPAFSNTSHRMILANHTLKQLNIVHDGLGHASSSRLASVASWLNRCQTSMGKRRFDHQLTHPTFDEAWLEREYAMTDHVLRPGSAVGLPDVRARLRDVRDIEKIIRQMVLNRVLPSTLYQLYTSLKTWVQLYDTYIATDSTMQSYVGDENGNKNETPCTAFLHFLETTFQLDNCAGCFSTKEFEQPILQMTTSQELASCYQKQRDTEASLMTLVRELNAAIIESSTLRDDCIKLHHTEKSGVSIQITKKRGEILKEIVQRKKSTHSVLTGNVSWGDIHVTKASANYDEIVFPHMKQITHDLLHMEEQINRVTAATYTSLIQQIVRDWGKVLEECAKQIATFDTVTTKAFIASEYRYCRPHIDSGASASSWVKARGVRHALIEHIQTNELYVKNDLAIGTDVEDAATAAPRGILLYGTNAVGKTSMIRALGIAVIMAQAGLFVPCDEFVYKPYRAVYSRILNNDNLFRGLSTFAVEMSELRVILKMADQHSLVLGDELCSGTEIESALAIFAAGLVHLHERKASFFFATHFHDILRFQELKDLAHVAIKHLSVVYDPSTDCLVYDRLLKDGPGNGMYGIEVAKSMHLDVAFIEQAYHLRNKYFGERAPIQSVMEQPASHYNAKKVLSVCEICHQTMGEEIHHLQYQQHADDAGFIDHFHKNHPANLISICTACHDQLHRTDHGNSKKVRKKTTKGYVLSDVSK